MQNTVNTVMKPLTETPPTSTGPSFDSSVITANYRGRTITLANIIKTYCLTLPPVCNVDGQGKLAIDSTCPVTLAKPDWREIADTALRLATSVIPAGECLWALRQIAPYLASPLALVGTGLLPGANAIDVPDFETLAQIGHNNTFRLNDHYQQTGPINAKGKNLAPIGNDTHPFTGTYDGNNETITGLSDCLFGTIKKGKVTNLILENASIIKTSNPGNERKFAAVVACELKDHGHIANIMVNNGEIHTHCLECHSAIGAVRVEDQSKIVNLKTNNCNVTTEGK